MSSAVDRFTDKFCYMTLEEKKNALLDDLQYLPDTEERLRYLLDAGKNVPPLPEELKVEAYLIPGCVSQLWLVPEYREGRCYFQMDADAIITKGIAAVVCGLFNGELPEHIIDQDIEFLGEVGIKQALSPNRRNGLSNLYKHIKAFAEAQLG